MITSHFNAKLQILEILYEGDIKLNDLINFWNKVHSNKSMPRRLYVLIDATKAKYNIEPEEFPQLINAMEQHVAAYELIKLAFIQSRPKETAYSLLVEERTSSSNYLHSVFSTSKAALKWLIG